MLHVKNKSLAQDTPLASYILVHDILAQAKIHVVILLGSVEQ